MLWKASGNRVYLQKVNFYNNCPEIKADSDDEFKKKLKSKIQQVCGKFLFSGRAVDNTTQHALNELCIEASNATEETQEALLHFMDYLATHPDAKIIYRKSDMQLQIISDAAYLVAKMARSRAGGYHFLGNRDGKLFNGPIYVLAKIIKRVMASASEAECDGLFMNAQEAVPFITTLKELGHKQQPVPLQTNNSTANVINNNTGLQSSFLGWFIE